MSPYLRTDLIIATDEECEDVIHSEEDVSCLPNINDFILINKTYYKVIERTFKYYPELKNIHVCDCLIRVQPY
jgi:hypothetical protein